MITECTFIVDNYYPIFEDDKALFRKTFTVNHKGKNIDVSIDALVNDFMIDKFFNIEKTKLFDIFENKVNPLDKFNIIYLQEDIRKECGVLVDT